MSSPARSKVWALGFALAAALGLPSFSARAAQSISAPGITEPILDSTVGTPVAGIVSNRNVREGDFVRKSDVLVELDKALEELEVARREVVLEPLKADYEASKFLFEQPKSSVSKEVVEKKQADYQIALAEFRLAKEQVRRRSILAPFDGWVTEILVQVGESCQLQQPILRVVDTRRCYLVCNVDARWGHGLQPGQSVKLEIDSGPATVALEGKISFVSPVVDPASGLLKVKVIFENPGGKLRPGVAGRMIFEEAVHADARQ